MNDEQTQHSLNSTPRRAAFTLVELLFTIAIIAVLLSLLLPAVGSAVSAARTFKCKMTQRGVAFDFLNFADANLHGNRGDDARLRGAFRLETFQESQYQIDEFWAWGSQAQVEVPDGAGNNPMRCPEVRGPLTLRRNAPCTQLGSIDPPERISFGFNIRLHIAEIIGPSGPSWQWVHLTSAIVDQSMVPLFWDIDGAHQFQSDLMPVFSGPSLDSPQVFAGDRYWFPAMRHSGKANFAFVDGHVGDSRTPLLESAWQWGYQPPVR